MRRPYHRRRHLEPQPKEDTSSLPKILSNSAIILAVISAALYFHGRSLYEGYLSYWGLGSELFPVTTENAFYHAGWFYLSASLENWGYFSLMVVEVLCIYTAGILLCAKKPFGLIQRAMGKKKIYVFRKALAIELINLLGRFLGAALVVVGIVLISVVAPQKGISMAEVQHQKLLAGQPISKNQFEKVSLTFLDETGQGKNLSGYRLATSSSFYALFTDKGVKVLPLARITSMEMVDEDLEDHRSQH
ncbi:hypothetical protein A7E78_04005 [Syntrophotalea acetylenivorans]|uniref:Uncharacterized protein n=1 Tax=Syntrophotalea acetylenivorans TaxID=1842532 RepID=A0A1L3GMF1_9BACT|nr:hypothetical protein [Syntrophotalea acetylenivorans]APG27070.1 hypothetical protein A7E78_04005 [Syntrophotalea acetylenivorans]